MTRKIEIVRGTSNTFNIEVTDDDGNLYTLEDGERLLFGVKKDCKDADYVLLKIVTAGTNGVYPVEIVPADTIGLEYDRYVYDVGLESGEDYYPVIEVSPFVIAPNVTKWGDGT